MKKDRDWQLAILAGATKIQTNTDKMKVAFSNVIGLNVDVKKIPSRALCRFNEFLEIVLLNFEQIHTWIDRSIELEQSLDDNSILEKVLSLVDGIDLDMDYDADSLRRVVHGEYTLTFEQGFQFTESELSHFKDIVTDIYEPIKYLRILIFTIARANDFMNGVEAW